MLDPERLSHALGGAAGAVVYGLFYLVAKMLAGRSPTAADYARAGANVSAAIVSGAATAYFLTPVLTKAIPLEILRDPLAVAFAIGALGWELLPVIMTAAKSYAAKLGSR